MIIIINHNAIKLSKMIEGPNNIFISIDCELHQVLILFKNVFQFNFFVFKC